jgi:hypothetical protein
MYYNHKGKLCKQTFTENSSHESENFLKRYFVDFVGKEQRWNADKSMGTNRVLNNNILFSEITLIWPVIN